MTNNRFAYTEGTTFTAVENATPTSMYIADVNKLMLVVVNRFLILTADQLSNYMVDTLHLEGMNATDIEKQLQLMTRANFLTEYAFRNSENHLMYAAYGLGYRGRGLLKAMNEAPRMTDFIAQLDACRAMKLLSSNQYLIESNTSIKTLQVAKTILAQGKDLQKTHLIARPQGMVQNDKGTQLLESVRRNANYLAQLLEKLGRMQLLLDRDDLNVQLSDPSVLLICEDEEMLAEVQKGLQGKKYCFDVFGTEDGEIVPSSVRQIVQASEKRFWDRPRSRFFYAA